MIGIIQPDINTLLGINRDKNLLVITTPGGKKILGRYSSQNTRVQDVLNMISDDLKFITSIPNQNQVYLKYGKKYMNPAKKLTEYNIKKPYDIIQLVNEPEPVSKINYKKQNYSGPKITLFIKTLTGKTLTIYISPLAKIGELQLAIQEKEGIPPEQQRIVFSGIQLEPNETISNYGIKYEATLHLILRLCGGMYHEYSGRNGEYQPLEKTLNMIYEIGSDDLDDLVDENDNYGETKNSIEITLNSSRKDFKEFRNRHKLNVKLTGVGRTTDIVFQELMKEFSIKQ